MSKIAKNKTKLKQKIDLLETESEVLKHELEGELNITKARIADAGKLVLGIASGLVFSAIILGGIAGRRRKQNGSESGIKSKKVYHRFREQLVHELTGQATEFLLGVVKDKLRSYSDKGEISRDEDSQVAD